MSGPKGGAYRVVAETAEQREARMLRDAMARYARAQSLWQAAQSRMATTSAAVGKQVNYSAPKPVGSPADSAAYVRAAQEWEAAAAAAVEVAAAAREEFADTRYAAQVARIAAVVGAAESATTPARPARTQHEHQRPAVPQVNKVRTAGRVRRRLEDLAVFDHDADRVLALVGDIARAQSESRVDLLVSELDIILAEAREAAKRSAAIEAARCQLQGLSAQIADIQCAAADSVRKQIESMIASRGEAVPAGLTAAVEELIDDVDAEADRQHVIGAMRRALEKLGYAVGPEFTTDLGGPEGTAFVGGPTLGYGVKVRLEPGDSRFSAQAVKSDAVLTSVDEDIAAERQFCDVFNELIELAKDDGVVLDVDIAVEPGEYAVQQVAASELAEAEPGRAAKRTTPREMRQR